MGDSEHVKTVVKANRYDCDPDLFRILTCDVQDNAYPNIAERAGQELIEEHLDGVEAVFLDNLNALGGAAAESNAEEWEKVRSWQLKLRRERIASTLVHHSGKTNDQRGLSAKEDVLDWSLKLEHPSDYREDQGARFNVRFTKMRRQAAVPPFEAWLEPGREEGGKNRLKVPRRVTGVPPFPLKGGGTVEHRHCQVEQGTKQGWNR